MRAARGGFAIDITDLSAQARIISMRTQPKPQGRRGSPGPELESPGTYNYLRVADDTDL